MSLQYGIPSCTILYLGCWICHLGCRNRAPEQDRYHHPGVFPQPRGSPPIPPGRPHFQTSFSIPFTPQNDAKMTSQIDQKRGLKTLPHHEPQKNKKSVETARLHIKKSRFYPCFIDDFKGRTFTNAFVKTQQKVSKMINKNASKRHQKRYKMRPPTMYQKVMPK